MILRRKEGRRCSKLLLVLVGVLLFLHLLLLLLLLGLKPQLKKALCFGLMELGIMRVIVMMMCLWVLRGPKTEQSADVPRCLRSEWALLPARTRIFSHNISYTCSDNNSNFNTKILRSKDTHSISSARPHPNSLIMSPLLTTMRTLLPRPTQLHLS